MSTVKVYLASSLKSTKGGSSTNSFNNDYLSLKSFYASQFYDTNIKFASHEKIDLIKLLVSQKLAIQRMILKEFNGVTQENLKFLYDFQSDRMMKINKDINLTFKSLKLKFELRITGQSCFNIVSRSKQFQNEETYIIKLAKVDKGLNQRLFLLVGFYDQDNLEFMFSRKTEIPLLNLTPQNIQYDYVDISLTLIDNGNDKLLIEGCINGNKKHGFKCITDKVTIPYFEAFSVYYFGEGLCTIIKLMRFEIKDRIDIDKKMKKTFGKNDEKCCCSIF